MNLFIHGRLGHFLMSEAPADGAPSGAAEPVPTPAAEPQTRHSVGALNSFADNQVPTVFEFDTEHRLGTGDVIYDTATIQAAINGTSGALSLGEFGTSFTVSRLTGRSNLDLQGRGTLDFSSNASYASAVADPLFRFPGTAGAARALTANATPGTKVISVDTAGIAAGDIIEIGTPGNAADFIDTSTAVSNAETRKVARIISAGQLELSDPIVDEIGYSVANLGQVRLLSTMKNVTIREGVTIKGKGRPASGSGDIGIVFFYGETVKVHCKFLGVDSSAVRFESCYDAEASWCRVKHDPQGANTTVNYGIVPSSSSSWVKIHHNFFENMRHAVVTSHLSAGLGLGIIGVVRELDIYNNYIINTWHAGIATHNDADRVRIYKNMLVGCFQGINPRERNIEVSGNNFHRCGQGVVITSHPRNLLIESNEFENIPGSAILGTWDGARDCTDLTIRGNKATRMGGGISITLPAPVVAHERIFIEDFIATDVTGAGGTQAVIRINGASFTGGTLIGHRIRKVTGASGIAIASGANDVPIAGNVVRDITGSAFSTGGTLVNVFGKGNYYPTGTWTGNSALTNSATFLADNTAY